VIVLNHSSIVDSPLASPVPAADSPQPGRPLVILDFPAGSKRNSHPVLGGQNSSPGPRPFVQAGRGNFHCSGKLEGY